MSWIQYDCPASSNKGKTRVSDTKVLSNAHDMINQKQPPCHNSLRKFDYFLTDAMEKRQSSGEQKGLIQPSQQ
jgi:hypothetical protein